MKRFALIAASTVFCVCLLAGCGTTSGASSSSEEALSASDTSASLEATDVSASAEASDTSASAEAPDSQASAQSQSASAEYVDTRERTVDPVEKPDGSLVDDLADATKVVDSSVVEALEGDMNANVIPLDVSVYAEDASSPFVICTSADDVVNFYNAIAKIDIGEAATPEDTTYYAVAFTMQNGDIADFVFSGRDCLVVNDETRSISNAEDLWALVQALIDDAEE